MPGIAELKDETRLAAIRDALAQARDQENHDWTEIGRPFAELLDTIQLSHPKPPPVTAPAQPPQTADIDRIIRSCGKHLLSSFCATGSSQPTQHST